MTPETELAELSVTETLTTSAAPDWLDEVRAVALLAPCAILFLLLSATVLVFALVAGAMLSPAIAIFAPVWMAHHDRATSRAAAVTVS